MDPTQNFINGGGWIVHEAFGRPKARLFAFLSLVWCLVCVVAGMLVYSEEMSLIYRWACVALLTLEPVFIVLAIVFAIFEKPRAFRGYLPNPDYDASNLY